MLLSALALTAAITLAAAPTPARAVNPVKPLCNIAGWVSGIAGKACGVLQNSKRLASAGEKLFNGKPGAAAKALFNSGASKVARAAGLAAVGAWVLVGAKTAMSQTAKLINSTTSPQLKTTWFSATYWRMAGIAAVLTLPFLFAAAVQALVRSDLALLLRAAFGYLPLALLGVSIAAPVTMLLLAASDEMSSIVSSAAGGNGTRALDVIAGGAGAFSALFGSPFLAFLVGLLLAAGALALWLELLVREAAVYVVVLMLPLAFAALAWPARRIWAIRAVEMLIALILAKFAIVAVLALAAAGLGHTLLAGPNSMLAGLALVTLATLAPWALVRLLPMAELASAAAGPLRQEIAAGRSQAASAEARAENAAHGNKPVSEMALGDGDRPPRSGAAREGAAGSSEAAQAPSDGGQTSSDGGQTPSDGAHAERTKLDRAAAARQPAGEDAGPAAGRTNGDRLQVQHAAPDEGRPGLPALYDREDETWRPLTFGFDDGWPPPPLDPPGEAAGPPEPHGEPAGEPEPNGEPAGEPEPHDEAPSP